MSSQSQSFHLPDLVNLSTRVTLPPNPINSTSTSTNSDWDLSLRTVNKHCLASSRLSSTWATDEGATGFLSTEESEALPRQQLGLLAALCFPTVDPPQLKLAVDVLTLIWHRRTACVGCSRDNMAYEDIGTRIHRTTKEVWQNRFHAHFSAFIVCRPDTVVNTTRHLEPDTDVGFYLEQAGITSGTMILLDLIEFTAGLHLPDEVWNAPAVKEARTHACAAIICLEDIASYPIIHSSSPPSSSLVSLLITRSQAHGPGTLTLQGAINAACSLLTSHIDAFHAHAQELGSFLSNANARSASSVQRWGLMSGEANADEVKRDLRAYMQGLSSCIVGYTHWMYETERFFGEGGEDVKAFGWVFLKSKKDREESV